MPTRWLITVTCCLLAATAGVRTARAGALPDNDILIKAMVDELERSMSDLVLEGLPRPYFIEYRAEDRLVYTMAAARGGLVRSSDDRTRTIHSRVRVGSMELDNTNVGHGGTRARLPIDDDYIALRHAIWDVTDRDYKTAVEILTRKKAYLKQKTIEDRPPDFSPADPVTHLDPSAEIACDQAKWEERIKALSARVKAYPAIQDSAVTLFAGAVNQFIVNSEGTRLRTADTGAYIRIDVRMQAEDGMWLDDNVTYIQEYMDAFPEMDEMLEDMDELCANLITLSKAPVVEQYLGPVLFDPVAAATMFEAVLAEGLCARPIPLGRGGSWGSQSLEKRLGRRILPRSFQVVDDPTIKSFEGTLLAGSYKYDDEAVPPQRVQLVEDGILKRLVAGRAPTKKIKKTTGHGRASARGDTRASIGCLFISDEKGISDDELKTELIDAVLDEGIDYGLRIKSLEPGGDGRPGSPIYAYRVYAEDGREELVRGMEFRRVETRALKRLLAAGDKQGIYNSIGAPTSSVIAPAVLFDELELTKFAEEFDKLPILKPPELRGP